MRIKLSKTTPDRTSFRSSKILIFQKLQIVESFAHARRKGSRINRLLMTTIQQWRSSMFGNCQISASRWFGVLIFAVLGFMIGFIVDGSSARVLVVLSIPTTDDPGQYRYARSSPNVAATVRQNLASCARLHDCHDLLIALCWSIYSQSQLKLSHKNDDLNKCYDVVRVCVYNGAIRTWQILYFIYYVLSTKTCKPRELTAVWRFILPRQIRFPHDGVYRWCCIATIFCHCPHSRCVVYLLPVWSEFVCAYVCVRDTN